MADDLWREAWSGPLGELQRGEGDFIRRVRPRTMAYNSDEPLPGQVALSSGRAIQRPLRRVGACGDLRKLEPSIVVSERSPSPTRRFQEEDSWTLLLRRRTTAYTSGTPATRANTPVDPSEDDLSSVPPTLLLSLSESDSERNEINALP